ncbi:Hypothetical protein CCH01_000910 [Clostridium chauvoei JF4335]|nr:Hypothetical protein CCH01_000910 [Clostridium chauvoei JF4335]
MNVTVTMATSAAPNNIFAFGLLEKFLFKYSLHFSTIYFTSFGKSVFSIIY